MACGRTIQLSAPVRPPIPKVTASSCKGGMAPLAAVRVASEAQSRTAENPTAVARRGERCMRRW